ncbi:RHS repeat-associated protein, partial [Roseimicrobium gellanilyticum]
SSVHSYAYDYRTRRITRSEPGSNPVAMTFSGGLSVAEFEVTDPGTGTLNTQPTVEYQRGPDMGGGVGGLLYSLRSGTAKFNLSNGRGDVVAQSDSSGDLTWTASYEAYGKRPVETGVNADRQRANTKEEDPTGLLNEGFRYRDLETGVWLSRDPAGFVDGPNLYAYVRQNPWTSWDPEGLQTFLAPQPPMVLPRIAPAPSIPFTNPTPVPRLVPGPYVPPTVPTVRIAPPPSALMMPDGGTSPQPQPQPNPTQTQQKTEEKNVRYLYRVMKPASDGFPESEPPLSPLRRTGVRVPGDIAPDADGSAQPLTGGMSVAPDSPRNLHPTVRPKVLGGHNPKDQLYRIKESDLGPNLRYVPDPPVPGELPHGTVQPTQKVPFEKYEQDLKGTRLKWERVDPNNYIKRIPPEVQAWLT